MIRKEGVEAPIDNPSLLGEIRPEIEIGETGRTTRCRYHFPARFSIQMQKGSFESYRFAV